MSYYTRAITICDVINCMLGTVNSFRLLKHLIFYLPLSRYAFLFYSMCDLKGNVAQVDRHSKTNCKPHIQRRKETKLKLEMHRPIASLYHRLTEHHLNQVWLLNNIFARKQTRLNLKLTYIYSMHQ